MHTHQRESEGEEKERFSDHGWSTFAGSTQAHSRLYHKTGRIIAMKRHKQIRVTTCYVGCPSFTEIPQHCANLDVLITTGFLLNNNCLLSYGTNRSFCFEDICTSTSCQKETLWLRKSSSNSWHFSKMNDEQMNTELQLVKAHLQRNPLL